MILPALHRIPNEPIDDVGRRGMTLVEMLVATAVTLILVGLVVQLFGVVGNSVTESRSLLESTDQLRSTAFRLRTDLSGITAVPLPPAKPESDRGYLEVIEGPITDATVLTTSGTITTITQRPSKDILGDCDDMLMFTTRSQSGPFVGTFGGTQSIESMTAEVAWFCREGNTLANGLTLYNLYRKQMLVMGVVGSGSFSTSNSITSATIPSVYNSYDISLRPEGSTLYANSLGDLTKRENRFLHIDTSGNASSFPFVCLSGVVFDAASGRQGEDLLLTNVIAFDVRVYDPEAAMRKREGQVLTPGDRGYGSASAISPTPKGAYIDLGADIDIGAGKSVTSLGSAMAPKARFGSNSACTYDTWTTHYEFNGINENAGDSDDRGTDTGSDGQDNDGDGLVDELDEYDTLPPYSVPLRGLEVRIRVYEPSSRQVRQFSVRHSFVPR
jgi:prepilin-type N-terminal cleavage/methylation domain-containing protein